MSFQKVLDEARKLLAKAERDAAGRPLLDSLCSADLDGLDASVKACGHPCICIGERNKACPAIDHKRWDDH